MINKLISKLLRMTRYRISSIRYFQSQKLVKPKYWTILRSRKSKGLKKNSQNLLMSVMYEGGQPDWWWTRTWSVTDIYHRHSWWYTRTGQSMFSVIRWQIFRSGQPNILPFHNVAFIEQRHGQRKRLNIKTLIHSVRSNVMYLPMHMNRKLKEQNN